MVTITGGDPAEKPMTGRRKGNGAGRTGRRWAVEVGDADEAVGGEDVVGAQRGGGPVKGDEGVAKGRERIGRVPGHLCGT